VIHINTHRYLTNFFGWLLAAITNSHLPKLFSLGGLLLIGAALQLLSQTLRPWIPPFPLFAVTFFFSGLGQAYQDSHANTFVSSVTGAHNWLGFIHAMYGFGCLVSPFVATTIASASRETSGRWMLFYLFPMGLSVGNIVLVAVAFRDEIYLIRRAGGSPETEGVEVGRSRSAMVELRQMMKIKNIWLISLFFFFHLGVGMTAGGMSLCSPFLSPPVLIL
jgi:fucose permease